MKNSVSLSGIVVGAVRLMQHNAKAIGISVACFTMLSGAASAYTSRGIDAVEQTLAVHFGMTRDDFETTMQQEINRMNALDLQAFVREIRNRAGEPTIASGVTIPGDQLGMVYIARVGPKLLMLVAIDCLAFFVAYVFFLIVFTRGNISPYEAAAQLPMQVLSQILLACYALIRSLIWIPAIGFLIAMYYVPRLSLAPVVMASGESGATESLRMSLARTKGAWFTVATSLMGILLIIALMLWPALVVVASVSLFSFKLSFIVWLASLYALLAFFAAAQTMLAVMLV